jgi:FkbM family methyltransferase
VIRGIRERRRERAAFENAEAKHRSYDEMTFEILRRATDSDSNCVDVGAHTGKVLQEIVSQAPHGTHHAFEPLPDQAAYLVSAFPTVSVHQVALSDAPGELEFVHVTSNPEYSGLRIRRYDRPNETLERIKVRVDTLDATIPPDLPIAYVKIDVEGAELGVLRGGFELLSRWRPVVVFEHGLGAADYYGTVPEDVHALFAEAGMAVSLMENFLAGRDALTVDEFALQFRSGANYYFVAYSAR